MKLFDREYTQPKHYLKGTHRSRCPDETIAAFAPCMPRLGITRLANVTGLDIIGLPVFMAVRPNARGISVAQGKGWDASSAKASALMEAIETWHGERIENPLRYESYQALARSAAVADIAELPARRAGGLRFDVPLLFVEGYDLLNQSWTWVPLESVSTNFVLPSRVTNTFFQSTNGLASGNHMLEAVVHGVTEVIERDAIALWELKRPDEMKARQLDLATVEDPVCRKTIELLAHAGVGVAAWDVTSEIGIPTYTATIFEKTSRPAWRPMGVFSGHGCHLCPEVALMRAISEAVQSRLTLIAGSRDDLYYRDYRRYSNEDDRAKLLKIASTPPPTFDMRQTRSQQTSTFEDDLAVLLAALRGVGIRQVIVVDLARKEIGVPVVKVVIPGLGAVLKSAIYTPGKRAMSKARRDA